MYPRKAFTPYLAYLACELEVQKVLFAVNSAAKLAPSTSGKKDIVGDYPTELNKTLTTSWKRECMLFAEGEVLCRIGSRGR